MRSKIVLFLSSVFIIATITTGCSAKSEDKPTVINYSNSVDGYNLEIKELIPYDRTDFSTRVRMLCISNGSYKNRYVLVDKPNGMCIIKF